jgi:formamidopyrimidine-DNA glycosylase
MPELPEVEILVRHLREQVVGKRIRTVALFRPRSLRGSLAKRFARDLAGQRIVALSRRAKYLRFGLGNGQCFLIHLGMTGRVSMETRPRRAKHDVAHIHLGRLTMVFHDPRKFGRLAWGDEALRALGPEPLARKFTPGYLLAALRKSRAPIKARLLDQRFVAGLGNIYACEALWRAQINPRNPCHTLDDRAVTILHKSILSTLRDAIRFGGGLSLNLDSTDRGDGTFYYGSGKRHDVPAEHFAVYDRETKPCLRCHGFIRRIRQGGRSTFYCERCQTVR